MKSPNMKGAEELADVILRLMEMESIPLEEKRETLIGMGVAIEQKFEELAEGLFKENQGLRCRLRAIKHILTNLRVFKINGHKTSEELEARRAIECCFPDGVEGE